MTTVVPRNNLSVSRGVILATGLVSFLTDVVPRNNLSVSRGVILATGLVSFLTEETLENVKAKKVCGVRHIMIRLGDQVLNTIASHSNPTINSQD
ncbi:hypothetical protein TNCT_741 [Trichonephila clavata]|uniref:Uncharacterized protein n=1 Tax=Trichonephila clavata TaxID=2740835 RepID=A0A8X6F4I9_TRICU|nr:hypothetical protein TNCT_741 [Trichonephila clavata]